MKMKKQTNLPAFSSVLFKTLCTLVFIEISVIFFLKNSFNTVILTDFLNVSINFATTILLWYAAKSVLPASRKNAMGWGILCLAQALFTIADLIWTVFEVFLKINPYPSITDVFYLAYYPVFFLGILFLSRKSENKILLFNNWLDATIIFIVLGLYLGVYIFPGIIDNAANEPAVIRFLSLAYPAGDLILFSSLLILIYNRDEERLNIPVLFIILSVAIQIVSDIIYSYQTLEGVYVSGGWLDIGWVLAYLSIGYAAILQIQKSQSQGPESVVQDSRTSMAYQIKKTIRDTLPILSIFLSYMVFFQVILVESTPLMRHIVAITGILLLLVTIRQFLTLWENTRLNRSLRTTLDLTQFQATNLEKINIELQNEIVQRKKAEDQLAFDALHDALTKLPNRVLLADRLQHAIEYSKRHTDYNFSFFFIDIDHFKNVNDSMGHSIGDQLLVQFVERVQTCLRKSDTLARLGGDEFAILLENNSDIVDTKSIAERIQDALRPPYLLAGKEFFVSASIGIVENTESYDSSECILQDADIAMYRAKALGKARYEVFTTSLRIEALTRLELESQLQHAIERNELFLDYQPIYSLAANSLSGFEALLRWKHPSKGNLLPADFIPLGESSGLIIKIGEWVLYKACNQMKEWQKKYPQLTGSVININISGKQFIHPNFIDLLNQVVQKTGLKPESICLEITETVLIENQLQSRKVFELLHEKGFEIQIDDFGTGYSSLGYLLNFHVDTIKIDKSFIQAIGKSNNSLHLVKTIVGMAQDLGIEIIAEGIETKKQLQGLKSIACRYGQGYYLSYPLGIDRIEDLIKSHDTK